MGNLGFVAPHLVLRGVAGQLVEEAGLLVDIGSARDVACVLRGGIFVVVGVRRVGLIETTGAISLLSVAELQALSRPADLIEVALAPGGDRASGGRDGSGASSGGGVVARKSGTSASAGEAGISAAAVLRASEPTALVVAGQTAANTAGAESASCASGGGAIVRAAKLSLAELCNLSGASRQ